MFCRVADCFLALKATLAESGEGDLIPSLAELQQIVTMSHFLSPLRAYTQLLSGENYPTLSMVKAVPQNIKDTVKANNNVLKYIANMKVLIAKSINKRYATEEQKYLVTLCSMLNPIFKNKSFNFHYPNSTNILVDKVVSANEVSDTEME